MLKKVTEQAAFSQSPSSSGHIGNGMEKVESLWELAKQEIYSDTQMVPLNRFCCRAGVLSAVWCIGFSGKTLSNSAFGVLLS